MVSNGRRLAFGCVVVLLALSFAGAHEVEPSAAGGSVEGASPHDAALMHDAGVSGTEAGHGEDQVAHAHDDAGDAAHGHDHHEGGCPFAHNKDGQDDAHAHDAHDASGGCPHAHAHAHVHSDGSIDHDHHPGSCPFAHGHAHEHEAEDLTGHDHDHDHDHAATEEGCPFGHDHSHDHAHTHGDEDGAVHAHTEGAAHDHAHDHAHEAAGEGGCPFGHDHSHGHDHAHDHDHGHDHAHDHAEEEAGATPRRRLKRTTQFCHAGHCHTIQDNNALLDEDEKHPMTAILLTTLSGLAAAVGGLVVVVAGVPTHATLGHMLSFASGIMMYISYCDLLTHAQLELDSMFWANTWMFVGMAFFLVVTTFVPEPDFADTVVEGSTKQERKRLMMTGMIAAIGISLHNFPEGLVVYNSVLTGVCDEPMGEADMQSLSTIFEYMTQCMGRGLAVSAAIALHNIPEGMAVAMPIYASTGSKWKAMKWCLLSSICEPFAAVVFGFAFNQYLTRSIMSSLNAVVAGIMIMLCIVELIPATLQHISGRAAAVSNLVGQVIMFLSLHFLIKTGAH